MSALLFTCKWRENSWIHTLPKSISKMGNAHCLVQDLNSGYRIHFLTQVVISITRRTAPIYIYIYMYLCVCVCVENQINMFRWDESPWRNDQTPRSKQVRTLVALLRSPSDWKRHETPYPFSNGSNRTTTVLLQG